jgi:hypothetical protein
MLRLRDDRHPGAEIALSGQEILPWIPRFARSAQGLVAETLT